MVCIHVCECTGVYAGKSLHVGVWFCTHPCTQMHMQGSCAEHARTPVGTRVKSSQVLCHHWHCYCLLFHSSGHRMQAAVCLHLVGCSVYLELFAPGVETQPNHLPWVDPNRIGTGRRSRAPAVHWRYCCVGRYHRECFWERSKKTLIKYCNQWGL